MEESKIGNYWTKNEANKNINDKIINLIWQKENIIKEKVLMIFGFQL